LQPACNLESQLRLFATEKSQLQFTCTSHATENISVVTQLQFSRRTNHDANPTILKVNEPSLILFFLMLNSGFPHCVFFLFIYETKEYKDITELLEKSNSEKEKKAKGSLNKTEAI
jgi:diaminopimelate epimerase